MFTPPRKAVCLHDESLCIQAVVIVESYFDEVFCENVLTIWVGVTWPIGSHNLPFERKFKAVYIDIWEIELFYTWSHLKLWMWFVCQNDSGFLPDSFILLRIFYDDFKLFKQLLFHALVLSIFKFIFEVFNYLVIWRFNSWVVWNNKHFISWKKLECQKNRKYLDL